MELCRLSGVLARPPFVHPFHRYADTPPPLSFSVSRGTRFGLQIVQHVSLDPLCNQHCDILRKALFSLSISPLLHFRCPDKLKQFWIQGQLESNLCTEVTLTH